MPSGNSSDHPTETTPLVRNSDSKTAAHQPDVEDGAHIQQQQQQNSRSKSKSGRSSTTIQILLLCYARIMEPMAFTSIFPYIAQMVERNGSLPVHSIGLYSGLIESLFSLTQAVCLIFWRVYAGRLGHKRMLVYSLCGMAVGQVLFGISGTLWEMILFRSITGAFSSSNLIIRVMIGEVCAKNEKKGQQARAFSWYSIAANVGIMFGPVIGGVLVDPVSQYADPFEGVWFFEKYPYVLPGFAMGAFSLSAAIAAKFFLDEIDITDDTEAGTENGGDMSTKQHQLPSNIPTWRLLIESETAGILWSYMHVMVCWTAIMALLPLILYTPISLGGIQFSQAQISIAISVLGACDTVWMLIIFPFLQKRVGTKGIMKTGAVMWPTFYVGFIAANALLRVDSKAATIGALLVGVFVATIGSAVGMSLTASQLAINEAVADPSAELLGKLNYVAELSISIIRSTVPAVATAIFAIGLRYNVLSGHLALVLLIAFALTFPFILKKVYVH